MFRKCNIPFLFPVIFLNACDGGFFETVVLHQHAIFDCQPEHRDQIRDELTRYSNERGYHFIFRQGELIRESYGIVVQTESGSINIGPYGSGLQIVHIHKLVGKDKGLSDAQKQQVHEDIDNIEEILIDVCADR